MYNGRSVALVGRPNVGKSRMFNRLAKRRLAIVHDKPGVTRDVNTTLIDDDYTLMDTGGIGLVDNPEMQDLVEAAEDQVYFAIEAATVILFMVDGKAGLTPLDELIADRLHKAGKPVGVVVNKVDSAELEDGLDNFYSLGFGDVCLVSAEHGRGIDRLEKTIHEFLGPKPEEEETLLEEERVRICFVGRPNVGKSSLCNRLLRNERLVVSEVPGTTRDSVEHDLDYEFDPKILKKKGRKRISEEEEALSGLEDDIWRFRLVDTAGVRRRGKIKSPVEFFSTVKSEAAYERSDIVFLVLDAMEGVTSQDKHLAGKVVDSGRTLAVIVNKWDYAIDAFKGQGVSGYDTIEEFKEGFDKAVRKEFFFLHDGPIIFSSAQTGFAMDEILKTAQILKIRMHKTLTTGRLNSLIEKLVHKRSPRVIGGKRFKVFYAVQTGVNPYKITFFCNQKAKLEDTYRRYIEKAFVSEFGLAGCPIQFEFRGKERRYADKWVKG